MAKLYIYGDKKSKHLSEFQADKIIKDVPQELQKEKGEYELLKTGKGVIYQTNRRQKTKYSFKIKRLCALLSKLHKQNILYDEKHNFIFTAGKIYVIADRVQTEEELEFHKNKIKDYAEVPSTTKIEVISLTKSKLVPTFIMDTETIKDYYKKEFKFPSWFRPFLKQRAFRVMNITNSFAFSSRRYNDTSKWTAEEKFVNDLVLKNVFGEPGKVYFTLARMLDSKLDREGNGRPLINLMLGVLDIDGECEGMHEINEFGICIKCMQLALEKESKVRKKLLESEFPYPIKTLFSGGKGLHLHLGKEITQNEMKRMIEYLNKDEELVDWFKDKDGNFDSYRIFKCPATVSAETACLIDETIKRIDVQDKIIEVENDKI